MFYFPNIFQVIDDIPFIPLVVRPQSALQHAIINSQPLISSPQPLTARGGIRSGVDNELWKYENGDNGGNVSGSLSQSQIDANLSELGIYVVHWRMLSRKRFD